MRISDWSSDVCSSDLHAKENSFVLDRGRTFCERPNSADERAQRIDALDQAYIAVFQQFDPSCQREITATAIARDNNPFCIDPERLGLAADPFKPGDTGIEPRRKWRNSGCGCVAQMVAERGQRPRNA